MELVSQLDSSSLKFLGKSGKSLHYDAIFSFCFLFVHSVIVCK